MQRKQRRNWEEEERIRRAIINEKFINMYVTNFPEDWDEPALKDILQRSVGKVINVTIPKKRAKNGKRFAFVRFQKERDEATLISRAKTVWIGLNRLLANVARFDKIGDYKPDKASRIGLGKRGIKRNGKVRIQV